MDAEDKERLARIEERTRCLPDLCKEQVAHGTRLEKIESNQRWVFTLIGAGWAAVIGLFKVHG